jgi:hypothetical protein
VGLDSEWKCGKLKLMFNENPTKPGDEFQLAGCYKTGSLFLISNDCKKNPNSCLKRGKGSKIKHPGAQMGSPDFVQCYNNGGRPRFLKIFVDEKWEDSSTCFFGSRKHFMDYDTIELSQEKKVQAQ